MEFPVCVAVEIVANEKLFAEGHGAQRAPPEVGLAEWSDLTFDMLHDYAMNKLELFALGVC